MDKIKIKQIESVGKKIGVKERPAVTDKNVLFIAGFLSLKGLKTHISDGLARKTEFLLPCIVLELKKRPKIRFKDQDEIFRKYLLEVKKRSILQLSNKQYSELIDIARKNGETKEYEQWRGEAMLKTIWVEELLVKYNKTGKDISKKEKFSLLRFEGGTTRLSFGNQWNESLRDEIKKLTLSEKRKRLTQLLHEFKNLKDYLKEGNF